MAKIAFDEGSIELAEGETVLDALLRDGREAPHSCRAGSCQSCLMRAVEGPVTARSQQGLKATLRAQGYFLACMEKPAEDLRISWGDAAGLSVAADVAAVTSLSTDVVKLTVSPREPFGYRPGQFVNLVRPGDGLVRSYSIASAPGWDGATALHDADADSPPLEMHVRRLPGGRMSNWIADDLSPGDRVDVRGPSGDCFYLPGRPEQPLLLAGTGTGLAPLWGIVRDALGHGHTGPIALYHGAINADGLYMVNELERLAASHENVRYRRCLLEGEPDASAGITIGRLDEQLLADFPDLKGWRVFLCGNPDLVNAMRKKAFLAGASMGDIHADAFVTAPATSTA